MTEKFNKNFKWRLEFESSLELLSSIQKLFHSAELSKLMVANTSKDDLETSSELAVRFWLASTLFVSNSSDSQKKSLSSKSLRSLCVELDSSRANPKFKPSQTLAQELKKLGYIRYKERKKYKQI